MKERKDLKNYLQNMHYDLTQGDEIKCSYDGEINLKINHAYWDVDSKGIKKKIRWETIWFYFILWKSFKDRNSGETFLNIS